MRLSSALTSVAGDLPAAKAWVVSIAKAGLFQQVLPRLYANGAFSRKLFREGSAKNKEKAKTGGKTWVMQIC